MNFLLYWGTAGQIAFVVISFGGGSVLGLYIVRRLVPLDRLQKNHDVAGVTFGVARNLPWMRDYDRLQLFFRQQCISRSSGDVRVLFNHARSL
jgi:hypothetical protein